MATKKKKSALRSTAKMAANGAYRSRPRLLSASLTVADLTPIEVHPGITKTPAVCGGDACIENTRMHVWGLYRAKLAGASDAELMRRYPGLTRRHLRNVWSYAKLHEDEIKNAIQENSW